MWGGCSGKKRRRMGLKEEEEEEVTMGIPVIKTAPLFGEGGHDQKNKRTTPTTTKSYVFARIS